jgi:diguanylate cyclase (GGDEF)-like protein
LAACLRYLLLLLCWMLLAAPLAAQPREIVLQLKSRHQWQFAGYYAAIEHGYFRDAGFEVTLREAEGDIDPVTAVLEGEADYGIAGSDLLLHFARGAPVVALSAFFQHSPLVLIARVDRGVDTLADLIDHPVAIGSQSAELLALLQSENVPLERLIWRANPDGAQALIDGVVVAASGYLTDHPYELDRAGVPYRMFSPRMAGIDFYSEVLFTSKARVQGDPAEVEAFVDAARRGWSYAVQHPVEIAELIHQRHAERRSLSHLRYEAARSLPLIVAELVEPGYMQAARWQHIAQVSTDAGLLPSVPDLDGFLFEPVRRQDLARFYLWLALASLTALFFGALSLGFYRLNRRLRQEIANRVLLEARLRDMAYTDSLTGALNRRSFIEQFRRLRAQASRDNQSISLISCDLDMFKQFNDTWGHEMGDNALTHFVTVVQSVLREGDLLARAGGEEFLILLPNTSLLAARSVADRLHEALNATAMDIHGMYVPLTASIGVAMVIPEEDEDRALRRADSALYEAKRLGRNTVCVARAA